MLDYEIRLLTERFTPSLTMMAKHPNDEPAINSAHMICDGKPFEVWRDLGCIHMYKAAGPTAPFPVL